MNFVDLPEVRSKGIGLQPVDAEEPVRKFMGSSHPRLRRLIMEETILGARVVAECSKVSASYGRFFHGADMPVDKPGSKILG